MATVAFRASNTGISTTNSVVVTKPVGLAVGDTMHAIVACATDATAVVNTPSGWTRQAHQEDGTNGWAVFTKVADAADVAASNFTFTSTTTGANFVNSVAGVAAFTNGGTVPVDQAGAVGSGTNTSLTTTGITPTREMGTFVISAAHFDSTVRTVSTYAIATNNPTWTEAYDAGNNGTSTDKPAIAMAYASRPEITSSGSATATLSSTTNRWYIQVLNIAPPRVLEASIASSAPGISSVRVVLNAMASMTSSALIPTFTAVAQKWRNLPKNISSWRNLDKS